MIFNKSINGIWIPLSAVAFAIFLESCGGGKDDNQPQYQPVAQGCPGGSTIADKCCMNGQIQSNLPGCSAIGQALTPQMAALRNAAALANSTGSSLGTGNGLLPGGTPGLGLGNQLAAGAGGAPTTGNGVPPSGSSNNNGLAGLTTPTNSAGTPGGGGMSNGGGGNATNMGNMQTSPAVAKTDSGSADNTLASAAGAGGGGGGKGGAGVAGAQDLFAGLGGAGGQNNAPGTDTYGNRNDDLGKTVAISDPEDYFTRLGASDNLFKVVERRYRMNAMTWLENQARGAAMQVQSKSVSK